VLPADQHVADLRGGPVVVLVAGGVQGVEEQTWPISGVPGACSQTMVGKASISPQQRERSAV
jgi:hypothetical protein